MTEPSIKKRARTGFIRVLIAVSIISLIVGAAAPAFAAESPTTSEVHFADESPTAPNPYFDVDTQTKSTHKMTWGTLHEDVRTYIDDNGDEVTGEYVVNTTKDVDDGTNVNPYTIDPAKIDDDDCDAFPRKGEDEDDEDTDDPAAVDNLASATDASEWTKSGANSSKLTLADASTGQDVDAFGYTTASMTTGDVATATYSNFTTELDNDEKQRVLQLGVVINTLDAGTAATVNVTDENGDVYVFKINATDDDTDADVIADATGTWVFQQKLGDRTMTSDGDGTFDNIENISITTEDGDLDADFFWIDLEQKGKTQLGEAWATTDDDGNDDDSDGDYDETQTIYNGSGTHAIKSLETMDANFGDAVIHDLQFPAKWRAQDLVGESGEEGEYLYEWSDAEDYPSYDKQLDAYYRMSLPAVIELSYSGMDLEHDQVWPGGRYVLVEAEQDVADAANFTDVDDEDEDFIDYADSKTSLFDTQDETVTIYSGVSSDTNYAIHYRMVFTQSEADAIMDTGSSESTPEVAATGGGFSFGGNNFLDMLFSIPGVIVTSIVSVLGIRAGWHRRLMFWN